MLFVSVDGSDLFSKQRMWIHDLFLMRCQPFAGIVNWSITTCLCCTCISYHGHGSCASKGVVPYILYVLMITFVSFRSVHCPCTRCFVKLQLLGIPVVLRNVGVFVFLDVVFANCWEVWWEKSKYDPVTKFVCILRAFQLLTSGWTEDKICC